MSRFAHAPTIHPTRSRASLRFTFTSHRLKQTRFHSTLPASLALARSRYLPVSPFHASPVRRPLASTTHANASIASTPALLPRSPVSLPLASHRCACTPRFSARFPLPRSHASDLDQVVLPLARQHCVHARSSARPDSRFHALPSMLPCSRFFAAARPPNTQARCSIDRPCDHLRALDRQIDRRSNGDVAINELQGIE
jgi:hypothetical protein